MKNAYRRKTLAACAAAMACVGLIVFLTPAATARGATPIASGRAATAGLPLQTVTIVAKRTRGAPI